MLAPRFSFAILRRSVTVTPMSGDNPHLLSPSLLHRLEQLQWVSHRRSRSSARGERQSKARGHSVEFADYRSYVPGDDLRHLDWNLYGRLDRLFVRLYEEERELPIHVFLDASASMNFGSGLSKFDWAQRLTAALGYVALCGFDRVTVRTFPHHSSSAANPSSHLRAVRGKRQARNFLANIAQLKPGGSGDLNAALRRGSLEMRRPGVVVVISDFLDPQGFAPGLESLVTRGCQVQVVQVLAPEEWDPPWQGDLRMVDVESGAEQEVTCGRFRLQAYQRTVEHFTGRLRQFCRARGIASTLVRTDQTVDDFVLRELRRLRWLA
jgi:uncharacterized protein (DUF58 family)